MKLDLKGKTQKYWTIRRSHTSNFTYELQYITIIIIAIIIIIFINILLFYDVL